VNRNWQDALSDSVAALLATGNEAVVYFVRRDLKGEAVGPAGFMSDLPETRTILRRQQADGSWRGPPQKTTTHPPDHSRLVGTFKAFRILVERYRLTRALSPVEKAAEYLLTFQTGAGDIRGFIANQYATYYTGYVLSLLMRAGYAAGDPRIERGIKWLLDMRQDDGGWTVPILTHYFDGKTMYRLTSSYAEPVEPDRSQPFSHNATDMVLRAFAAHPTYRQSREAQAAGHLLKSRFFRPDVYSSYKAASYWTRFVHWWPNLITAMESLSLMGYAADDPDVRKGLRWFFENRQSDGLWDCTTAAFRRARTTREAVERVWISLRICLMLSEFLGTGRGIDARRTL
jgi:hypothetical protein